MNAVVYVGIGICFSSDAADDGGSDLGFPAPPCLFDQVSTIKNSYHYYTRYITHTEYELLQDIYINVLWILCTFGAFPTFINKCSMFVYRLFFFLSIGESIL